ncbi:MAG: hypothetical protein AAF715_05765 [Myxococcota bacterium]
MMNGRRWRSGAASVLVVGLGVLATSATRADPTRERYTDYERQTISAALAEREGRAVDLAPAGKRIRRIDIEVLDVIEDRDPAPNFLNVLHVTSQDHTVRRELLFREGEPYDVVRVNESERNLRGLRQLSLVVILPLTTSDPDAVDLLVVVKDVWSLRLNSDFRFRNGELELLFLQPAEENLFGTHRRAFLNFLYEPDTVSVGARFNNPWLAGSRIAWTADANVSVNHATGDYEGSRGFLQYGLPLYSTRRKWSWGAAVTWRTETTRRFVGTALAGFDAEVTEEEDGIPFRWDTEEIGGQVSVTRSFGYAVKNDVTVGAAVDRSVYRPDDLSAFDPRAARAFSEEVVPPSQTRNGPFVSWRFFLNDFGSLTDVETMGLQENYLLGPTLAARVTPIAEVFGATRNVIAYSGTAAYTARLGPGPFGDGVVRAYVSGGVEHDLDQGGQATDTFVQAGARAVSPSIFVGRLVWDGGALFRPDNFSNALSSLGGGGRLRGYPTAQFLGENFVVSNLEFRSRTFNLWTVLVGGALFYDVGDAYDGDRLEPKQGAGFGLRVLFPQIGRAVLRFDWGFAIDPPVPTGLFDGLVFTFNQAFGFPSPSASGVATAAP